MAVDSAELYAGDIKSVLLSEEQIRTRTVELAEMIAEQYRDNLGNDDLLLVTVLKGAVMFVTDLARTIPLPTQLEFMAVSSYGSSTSSSGVVRILKDLDRDINDRDVLIVEDIIDTGTTTSWLIEHLQRQGAASIQLCALLDKPARRRTAVPIDYLGFTIPDHFVVGYGIDYGERYRQLPYVGYIPPGEPR